MELCKMAQEYRRNTALLELRKKQLLAAKRHAKQYEVLRLETVEGMNGKEVAARLGITQSAVSRHKSRGMKRLRSLLSYNLELL